MKIRTLIVDDEPLARERIRRLLQRDPEIEIVGESADGQEAVAAIQEEKPELLFLDVQMPGLDGFGVLEAIGADEMPVTIFVTAYDKYALQAFEVHALDYLLKPFDRERFDKALQRARAHLQRSRTGELSQRLEALLGDVESRRKAADRLIIKSANRVFFIRLDEIDWIEAAGNYVRLHVARECYLHRETMNSVEARLDPEQFLRIHRSTIVNIERIQELQPLFHGDYVVLLRDGTQLTLSRGYRPRIQERFGKLL